MFRRPIKPDGRGGYQIELSDHQRALLRELAPEMREMITLGNPEEMRRLFPTTHPDDDEAEAEYRKVAQNSLLGSRLEALDLLEERSEATVLNEDELNGWMQALNSIRLVLGTRLDVSDDDDWEVSPDDPEAAARATYAYLSYLLEEIVQARMSSELDV